MPQIIPFIDLQAQQKRIEPQLRERILRVLDHGKYIMGPEVQELEEKLAAYVGVKHAISCASGTDALLMVLMAYSVGPGDAVFAPAFTFFATASMIQLLGATPVLVDVDPRTFNIDPAGLEKAITALQQDQKLVPKGVITVDLFGQPAAYERINALAKDHGLFVLEDAAQSFGAIYQGRRAGSLADTAATSFYPAKPLGAYGEGGAIFTDDDKMSQDLRSIRNHGAGTHSYDHVRLGLNGRLDTIQAAILLAKLEIFDSEVAARQQAAERYLKALAGVVELPYVAPECTSVWAQFSVQSDARADLQKKLQDAGVPTAVHYPKPLHFQEAFASLGYGPGSFPVSERLAARIFSLPMHPYLSPQDQERIVAVMRD